MKPISKKKVKKRFKIAKLENRLREIANKNGGVVSYRTTDLFNRKIEKIKNSFSKED